MDELKIRVEELKKETTLILKQFKTYVEEQKSTFQVLISTIHELEEISEEINRSLQTDSKSPLNEGGEHL